MGWMELVLLVSKIVVRRFVRSFAVSSTVLSLFCQDADSKYFDKVEFKYSFMVQFERHSIIANM